MDRKCFRKCAGIILIVLGIALNKWTIASLFSDNGQIDNKKVIFIIWTMNIFLILIGLCVLLLWESFSKTLFFRKSLKIARTSLIILGITGVIYFVVDSIFGFTYPIKPWEKELNIMSAVSYIEQPYYTKDFMLEQANSSKTDYWDAPENTRLVFKKVFKGKYINTESVQTGSNKVYRKTLNQYTIDSTSTKKVLMLGGSTLYCLEVPDELTLSSLLAKKLNSLNKGSYFIVNAGVESDTSIQELERLKIELNSGFRPDIVIAYHGFNEINSGVYFDDPEAKMWEKTLRVSYKDRIYGILNGNILQGNIYDRIRLEADKNKSTTRTVPPSMMNSEKILESSKIASYNFFKNNIFIQELSQKYNFKYYSILQPVAVYGNYSDEHLDIPIVKAWADKNEPRIFSAFDIGYKMLKDSTKELEKTGIYAYDKTDVLLKKDKNIFTDTCHVNSVGNSIIADSIAEIITKNKN